jgi:hypothetical protein
LAKLNAVNVIIASPEYIRTGTGVIGVVKATKHNSKINAAFIYQINL